MPQLLRELGVSWATAGGGGAGRWKALGGWGKGLPPAFPDPFPQCSTFTGMIPVFGVLLILFEWYWYVVCESGIRTSLILLGATAGSAPQKANHICSIHLGAFSRQEFAEAWNAADEPAQQPQHDGASSRLAKAKCCLAWKVGGYPGGADRDASSRDRSFSTLGRRTSEQRRLRRHARRPQCTVVQRGG